MCPPLPVLFSLEALPEELDPDEDEEPLTLIDPPELPEADEAPSEDPPPLANGPSQLPPEEDPFPPEDERGSCRNKLEI